MAMLWGVRHANTRRQRQRQRQIHLGPEVESHYRPYMGQFLQDGKNVRFMSLFFKKWMARAAKPSDIDDFFRFAVTYHDFGMPLK